MISVGGAAVGAGLAGGLQQAVLHQGVAVGGRRAFSSSMTRTVVRAAEAAEGGETQGGRRATTGRCSRRASSAAAWRWAPAAPRWASSRSSSRSCCVPTAKAPRGSPMAVARRGRRRLRRLVDGARPAQDPARTVDVAQLPGRDGRRRVVGVGRLHLTTRPRSLPARSASARAPDVSPSTASCRRDAPEQIRGRTFARYETIFQLCWVAGAGTATLIPLHARGGIRTLAAICFGGIALSIYGLARRGVGHLHPQTRQPVTGSADVAVAAFPERRRAARGAGSCPTGCGVGRRRS